MFEALERKRPCVMCMVFFACNYEVCICILGKVYPYVRKNTFLVLPGHNINFKHSNLEV